MQPPRKICVILNESSGNHDEKQSRRDQLGKLLADSGLDTALCPIDPNGADLVAFARQQWNTGDCDALVAAGGDGTIAAVAEACHQADAPMGVIPQGTFNYFARGLGIPEDVEDAVHVLASGTLTNVALGEVNGDIFLNNASLGIYPLILKTREGVYDRYGRSRLAAYWSVLLALAGFRRQLRLSVTLDGQTRQIRTPLAFIANSAYQLEQFNLDGVTALRDGQFALFTSNMNTRLGLVRAALRLATGAAQNGDEFSLATAYDITVETQRPHALVARDGEKALMKSPLHFCRRERPLRVITPTATNGNPE